MKLPVPISFRLKNAFQASNNNLSKSVIFEFIFNIFIHINTEKKFAIKLNTINP